MPLTSATPACGTGRLMTVTVLAAVFLVTLSTSVRAQGALTADSAAVVKATFIADIEVMRDKFLALADAFPEDKYTWRPMDGVRSVSEVLMLIASEGYGFAPMALGGQPAMSRDESRELSSITDKAEVIAHLRKGFEYGLAQLESIDPATLTESREVFGQERSTPELVLFVAGDMHEHLGQLIAYARTNHIVPPWSR